MKSIRYDWMWLEYRYLGRQVEHKLRTFDDLLGKMSDVKKDLEAMKTRLYILEREVKAELEGK